MLQYKTYRKLIKRYLEDSKAHQSLYRRGNRIPKDWMFANFMDWCSEQKPQIKYKSKQVFFEEVLSTSGYFETIWWDKQVIVNTKVPVRGLGSELTVF